MTTQTYNSTGIETRTQAHIEATLLKRAHSCMHIGKFCTGKTIPRNKTGRIDFTRVMPLDVSTETLVEGVPPAAQSLKYENVSMDLRQYGSVIKLTDLAHVLTDRDLAGDAADVLGQQVGETQEQVRMTAALNGNNVYYGGGAATQEEVTQPLSLDMLRQISRNLTKNKARKITEVINATGMISTQPVEAAWVIIAPVELEASFRDMPGFTLKENYGSYKPIDEGELGSIERFRVIIHADMNIDAYKGVGAVVEDGSVEVNEAGNANIAPFVVLSKDCLATVRHGVDNKNGKKTDLFEAEGYQAFLQLPNTVHNVNDPLAQKGYIGTKYMFVTGILNEAWIARGEVAIPTLH